jgi:uncharacterized membrane protein YeaQ/YmgE (transglycosylase-associated protein family)
MAGLIGTLVIGLIIGAVAKLLMPGRDPGGCLVTILLGIAGALVAGYLGRAIGWLHCLGDRGDAYLAALPAFPTSPAINAENNNPRTHGLLASGPLPR